MVSFVASVPGSSLAAVGGADERGILILDLLTGEKVGLVAADDEFGACSITDDGRLAYLTSWKDAVSVLDLATMQIIARIPIPGVGEVYEPLRAIPGQQLAVAVDDDKGLLRILDGRTGEVARTLSVGGHPMPMRFTPDGERGLVVQAAAGLTMVDLDSWSLDTVDLDHYGDDVWVRPDAQVAFIPVMEYTDMLSPLHVVDLATRTPVKVIDDLRSVHRMVFAPDAPLAVVSFHEPGVAVLDTKNLQRIGGCWADHGSVADLDFSREGPITVLQQRGWFTMTPTAELLEQGSIPISESPIDPTSVLIPGRHQIAYAHDGDITIVDCTTGHDLATIPLPLNPDHLYLSQPHNRLIATQRYSESLAILDPTTQTVTHVNYQPKREPDGETWSVITGLNEHHTG